MGVPLDPSTEDLAPDLRFFEVCTVAFLAFSVIFHLCCAFLLHTGGWAAYPLSRGYHILSDFTVFRTKFHQFRQPDFWTTGYPLTYPAPAIVACEPFFLLPKHVDEAVFALFSLIALGIPAALYAGVLRRMGVAAQQARRFVALLAVCSWPAILLLDRGNVEVFVWIALAAGMWAYATGRLWTAAVCFGIATSMKLFPFVLFGLFLSRRQFSKVLAGAAAFLLSSLVCLEVLGPSVPVALRQISAGMTVFKTDYMASWLPLEGGVDHSLFGLYKLADVAIFHHPDTGFSGPLTIYLGGVAVVGVSLYILRIRKLPLLNQVFCLVIASVYFTAFSGDGTLIHLYYPFAMLVLLVQKAWKRGVHLPGARAVLGSLVVLLSCETFLVHADQRFIGAVHCIALGVLLTLTLRYPFGPALAQTSSERVLSVPDTQWLHAR